MLGWAAIFSVTAGGGAAAGAVEGCAGAAGAAGAAREAAGGLRGVAAGGAQASAWPSSNTLPTIPVSVQRLLIVPTFLPPSAAPVTARVERARDRVSIGSCGEECLGGHPPDPPP